MELAAAVLLEENGHPVSANSQGALLLKSETWSRLELSLRQKALSCKDPIVFAENDGKGDAPYIVWCTPLRDLLTQRNGRRLCLVFGPASQRDVAPAILREAFRLTRAEVRLVEQLLMGRTPAEASQALGVTIHTVRTYLKRLYRKVGARSQATLVCKLVRASVVPVRSAC